MLISTSKGLLSITALAFTNIVLKLEFKEGLFLYNRLGSSYSYPS
jgi:hypothetical protein